MSFKDFSTSQRIPANDTSDKKGAAAPASGKDDNTPKTAPADAKT